ncbi:MAG TPA: glycosyltransferase family 1 protein [Candidatus Omnitrophota bacterium]|nr:glycosyltransferase family 1 protein [Candidatus Omnitrophota bacterium]
MIPFMGRIGFDAQAIQGHSGLGVFTRHLLESLQLECHSQFELKLYSRPLPKGRDFTTLERLAWENLTLPQLVKKDSVDLLHVPAFAPPFRKPCPLIVTVHDIAGKLFKNQMGLASKFYWGKWLPFVVRQADRIIADSEHTKKDLMQHLKIPEKTIRVVYPSGHEGFTSDIPAGKIQAVKKNLRVKDRYFLFVGTLEPRKNIGRVLEAFRIFSKTHPDFQLVLAGSTQFGHGQYIEFLEKKYAFNSEAILTPGFLSREDLNVLYAGAEALIFPSLYEGFGIPILEAMASGCPVLTSNITSTPEVAGEAGMLVNPYNTEAIMHGMEKLAGDQALRVEFKQKGFEQIKKFSWQKTARETISVYKEFLKYGGRNFT